MNVLIHTNVIEITKIIGFQLESQLSLKAVQCYQFGDLLNHLLGNEEISLLILSPCPEISKLIKLLSSAQIQIPVIFINDTPEDLASLYPEIAALGVVNIFEVERKLVPLIRDNASLFSTSSEEGPANEEAYCRIHTSLLLKVAPLTCNIFIRLSSEKYVKMFQAGSHFSRDEYEKYLVRRNIDYFYIKKDETTEFLTKLSSQMDLMIAQAQWGDDSVLESVSEIQGVVSQMSGKLGFNEEVQSLIKKNMELTLKAIGQSKKLTKIIADSLLKGKNYLSQHSVMLASISCSLASQQEWASERTFEKLILASLLHDIHFQNVEAAKIGTRDELEKMRGRISDEDYKLVLTHPIRCSDLVKTMKEIPSDVDIVVLQHHETPDGKGFPKGLSATQISPLSAILIVAHDIVDALLASPDNFELEQFLDLKKELYSMGSFKKIAHALKDQVSDPGALAA